MYKNNNIISNQLIFILIAIIFLIKLNEYYFYHEPFEYNSNNSYGFCKIFPNFITEDECDELIQFVGTNYIDSTLIDDSKSSNYIDKSIRSSKVYFFMNDQHKIISNIKNKIAQELNIPVENIEPIQMVKYSNLEKYNEHYDFIEGLANQRTHTFIIYLNTLKKTDGGSTHFIKYNKKVYPIKGTAICFRNIDSFSRLNFMSLHSGEIVKSDTDKYILTIWIRQNKYE